MRPGENWRCADGECGAQIVVLRAPQERKAGNFRCVCGAAMKRPYEKPAVKRMFLEADERVAGAEGKASGRQ